MVTTLKMSNHRPADTTYAEFVAPTCFLLQVLYGEQSWHQNLSAGQMDQSRASVRMSVFLLLHSFKAFSFDRNLIPSLTLVFCQLSNATSHLQTERWSSKGCQKTSRPFFPTASSDSAARLLGSTWMAAPCWYVGKTESGISHSQRAKVGIRNIKLGEKLVCWITISKPV